MWILQWLPNWIFYSLFFLGIAGFLATYLLKFIPIPAIYIYRNPIQIISLILVTSGVFMAGAIHNEEIWLARVKELEVKLAQAEAESQKENTKIVEKIVYKNQIIKQRGEDIIKYIDKEIVKYDNQCVIPKEFVEAHNNAAKGVK
jgi:hypothetical protein